MGGGARLKPSIGDKEHNTPIVEEGGQGPQKKRSLLQNHVRRVDKEKQRRESL